MNKELLFQLYSIHSPSGKEKKMRKFLRKQARACGATSIETDAFGNLLIVKGESDTYPCLAAHIDQVQDFHSKDFTVVEIDGDVLAWSPKCHRQQGLGADDKNGIFVCLELLRRFDVMKVAFFVGEETGCVGSSQVDLSFFKDCRFIIEPDRMHGDDLITSMFCGRVCSDDFISAIGYDKYGYREERGSITDVGKLVERGVGISCLNLSCGYYNAHTDEEITILSELENCMELVAHIVETCTDVYPFEYVDRWSTNLYGTGHHSRSRYTQYNSYWWGDDDYYTDGYYETDENMMNELVRLNPDITLDEIVNDYAINFYTRDKQTLEELYDLAHLETENGDYWGSAYDDDCTVYEDITPRKIV